MGLTSFVLELGQVVEKNMKDRAVVASLVIVSALFHVVCFILLVILMVTLYVRSIRGPVPFVPTRDEKETTSIIAGLVVFGFGLYYLMKIYIPALGWQVGFLLVGALLIAFGISRGTRPNEAA